VWLAANKSRKTFFPAALDRWGFYSLLIAPIEQNSLIFVGCIDFAPCDGEIDHLAIYRLGRGI
jgi:hypothetical protein